MHQIAAADMARLRRVDPKRFRAALRAANFSWHRHDEPWTVEPGSLQHQQMEDVLASLISCPAGETLAGVSSSSAPITARQPSRRSGSDEHYILDLCDDVLGQTASRGHRFDFLRGDPGQSGVGRMLPVDGYYAALKLVLEYCERQHTEAVPFFDRRETVSGMGRGQQRALYDQRRRDVLPQQGLRLVELSFEDFEHDNRGRLRRVGSDRVRVAGLLQAP